VAAVGPRYKLVLSPTDMPWLFDLEADPDEITNFYYDPAYETIAQTYLEELLRQMALYNEPLSADAILFNPFLNEDFESHEAGTNLKQIGFSVNKGSAEVLEDETAYEGNCYAKCTPSKNNFVLDRAVPLVPGETYHYEVYTRSLSGDKHRLIVKIGDRQIQGDLVSNTEWALSSVTFTAEPGETSAILKVFSYPISPVDIDNFKFWQEDTPTSIKKIEESKIVVVPNPSTGIFKVLTNSTISNCMVSNSLGQIVRVYRRMNKNELEIDLSNQPKGVYFITLVSGNGVKESVKVVVED